MEESFISESSCYDSEHEQFVYSENMKKLSLRPFFSSYFRCPGMSVLYRTVLRCVRSY